MEHQHLTRAKYEKYSNLQFLRLVCGFMIFITGLFFICFSVLAFFTLGFSHANLIAGLIGMLGMYMGRKLMRMIRTQLPLIQFV